MPTTEELELRINSLESTLVAQHRKHARLVGIVAILGMVSVAGMGMLTTQVPSKVDDEEMSLDWSGLRLRTAMRRMTVSVSGMEVKVTDGPRLHALLVDMTCVTDSARATGTLGSVPLHCIDPRLLRPFP